MNSKNKSLMRTILPWLVILLLLSSLIPMMTRRTGNLELSYTDLITTLKKSTKPQR